MTPPISEDNPRDLDWKSQRTTGPESPKVLKNLKKDEDEDKEIEFELKRKRKKKDKIRRLEPDDYYEYGASFLPSNRYNESQFGPSYGNPDFHGTIDAKARALLKAVGCTCNI